MKIVREILNSDTRRNNLHTQLTSRQTIELHRLLMKRNKKQQQENNNETDEKKGWME